ncbi:MAG: MotA/TolQ/ExbB proton channel family protein, partial [Bacteroidales bacterium]|nr:MotA/TolQ/ExbB proton channel family protein [Bacteroidales bacterium]
MVFVLLQNVTTSSLDSLSAAGAVNASQVSYIDLVFKGGWVMVPIGILSLIAVYVFVERFMTIRNAAK